MRHLGPVGKRFSYCATFMKETEDSARKWLWVLGGDGLTLFFFPFNIIRLISHCFLTSIILGK